MRLYKDERTALFGFREHVRVRARSRAGATLIALLALPRRGSDAGTFTGCLPSERPRGGLARPRGGVHAQRELGNTGHSGSHRICIL
jgi:hypothetical protein